MGHGIIWWIGMGLLAGILARFLMPGKASGGLVVTIVIGILGALLGGYIGQLLGFGSVTEFNLNGVLLAVGGGVLLLFLYGLVMKARA
jgi:uncharacterized membrane protein YeaQ/YmgE (transglycosylase-associated protein family)